VQKTGAEGVVCDLDTASADDVAVRLSGADAVVFAVGTGPGRGASRKNSVDRAASVLIADAAALRGRSLTCIPAARPETQPLLNHEQPQTAGSCRTPPDHDKISP
jgi:hypothetical protein